jgi:diaminohydroxyphosphoribosylaminopyrimidine deaminase/5-amino-6-(5-phosphoribosylamino)uracil reductase
VGLLEEECKELNKRFFTFHTNQRPYVILKWAQTSDGYMAPLTHPQGETLVPQRPRLLISNELTNRLVHKWRSEEAAILVGTNTALLDNPELTTRLWPGKSPVRMVVDMNLRLPGSLQLFDGTGKTIIFNYIRQEKNENLVYYKLDKELPLIIQLMDALYQLQLQSVLVEGGAKMLQSFIDAGIWDEARVITNTKLITGNGLPAPVLKSGQWQFGEKIQADTISYFRNKIF